MIGFLAARATPGVERVEADRYQRTIAIGGTTGTIAVAPAADGPALMLDVQFGDPRALLAIVERVRRMFDLGADPAVIAEQLSGDPLLSAPAPAHAGIRTPGAWDAFEIAVRAILGQQISVKAATTIAGSIAARWGTPIDGSDGLDRLCFPHRRSSRTRRSRRPASSRPAPRRCDRWRARSATAALVFDGVATIDALRAIPGIGDWTAQYVAMRALNEPDAFPSGDLVLRRMAGGCSARELERRSEPWRPWRAYAVMLLWQAASDRDQPTGGLDMRTWTLTFATILARGGRASDRPERAGWR